MTPAEEAAEGGHIPVMAEEVVAWLKPRPGAVFVDGTLGAGGHARRILRAIGPEGRLIALDKDGEILRRTQERLKPYAGQCHFIHRDYARIEAVLEALGVDCVDGILLDLGVSSYQLDCPRRGFSFRADGPLDMRMNQENSMTAYDLVNTLPEHELAAILRDLGEERRHKAIAGHIVRRRQQKAIATTAELRDVVLRATAGKRSREKIHPATRTFQALRMAVNKELDSLKQGLLGAWASLRPEGRLGVIAFHSLEDRMVKQLFRQWRQSREGVLPFKKPLRPSEEEVARNPRARSARFRVIERVA